MLFTYTRLLWAVDILYFLSSPLMIEALVKIEKYNLVNEN